MLSGNRSFRWLTVSQALGAFNDNAYRQFILLLALSSVVRRELPEWFDPQTIAMGAFSVAFVILALLGGSLADRFSKRDVIVGTNFLEIIAMALGLLAFASVLWFPLWVAIFPSVVVLFLMGSQSALFGPSKYGILPEIVPEHELTRANGIISMTTQIAIVGGIFVAGELFQLLDLEGENGPRFPVHTAGFFFVAVAAIGFICSLGIRKIPAADPERRIRWDVWRVPAFAVREFRWLAKDRALFLATMASSWYWLIASIALAALNVYGKDVLGEAAGGSGLFLWVALGIATGSLLASRLSKNTIELGLIPIGAAILGCGFGALYFVPEDFRILTSMGGGLYGISADFPLASLFLYCGGIGGGLYVIPLLSFIQQRPSAKEKGRVTGIHELANFIFILGGALVYGGLAVILDPRELMIALAVLTVIGSMGIFFFVPHLAVRLTLWGLIHTIYRIEVRHAERIPKRGGALLVANHVSFADPFLVGASMPRYVRYLIHRELMRVPVVGFFARMMRAIPVASTDSPREVLRSLDAAADAVREGNLTCIFAEGGISRTGNLLPFSRGFERVARRAEVPILPVYLGRVWGSIFSFQGGRFFFKRPLRLPYPVTVSIGEPLPPNASVAEVRRAVQELSAESLEARKTRGETLATEFLTMSRRRGGHPAVIEHGKDPISHRRLLTAVLLVRSRLRARLRGEETVGILLPAGSGGAIANLAVTVLGKTSVNLNFTAGVGALRSAAEQTGLKAVITARAFLDRIGLDLGEALPGVEVIEFPEVIAKASTSEKLRAAMTARLPGSLLRKLSGVPQDPDAVATVVFSSGSTGDPKGVMLTHHNILSNVRSVSQVFDPRRTDRIVGVLPFFHSFGYSVTIWFPFLDGMTAIYHPNPLDVKVIAELVREHRGTIFLATPTFYRSYLRRFTSEDFSTVRLAVSGAEKLKVSLTREWEEKFGHPILEGYGCTELSPVVSVNLPDVVRPGVHQRATKVGSIGHPLPGIVPKIVDPETFVERPLGEEGLLLIKGPNVMKGYLGKEKETAEVIRDGWYVTGDIAKLDEDGFITITDRLSRFSKLGGEMVPHVLVEERLQELIDAAGPPEDASDEDSERPHVAVTAVPDPGKGERLVVVHTPLPMQIEALLDGLGGSDLPRLWLPRRDSFVEVSEIPRLGSGKLDLMAIRAIALERLEIGEQ